MQFRKLWKVLHQDSGPSHKFNGWLCSCLPLNKRLHPCRLFKMRSVITTIILSSFFGRSCSEALTILKVILLPFLINLQFRCIVEIVVQKLIYLDVMQVLISIQCRQFSVDIILEVDLFRYCFIQLFLYVYLFRYYFICRFSQLFLDVVLFSLFTCSFQMSVDVVLFLIMSFEICSFGFYNPLAL